MTISTTTITVRATTKKENQYFFTTKLNIISVAVCVYQFVLKKTRKKKSETDNYVKNEIESVSTFTVIIYYIVAEKVILEARQSSVAKSFKKNHLKIKIQTIIICLKHN